MIYAVTKQVISQKTQIMNIALIGYGRMGHEIESIAVKRGHVVKLIVDQDNENDLNETNLKAVDVAIEFSSPTAAFLNVSRCLDEKVPVVSGTTGWLEKYDEAVNVCNKNKTAFIHSSNFSLGVNMLFRLNSELAKLMEKFNGYSVSIEEIHHTKKLDAPSGTAITLAEQILQNVRRKKSWVNHTTDNPRELEIISERTDPAPGTHRVKYSSSIDDLEIIHTAHNRMGFATGAVWQQNS